MLGAVARLRIADAAYAAGKASEAVAAYDEAAARLKSGPLASRAKLGLAMAKLQAGKTAEGESALKALMADVNEMKATRVEAAYHLASLASVAGKSEEVKKYSDELMKIDANSPWAQRVFMLRASMPVADVPPNLNIAPVALPPSGK
jgi:hypothetical protein